MVARPLIAGSLALSALVGCGGASDPAAPPTAEQSASSSGEVRTVTGVASPEPALPSPSTPPARGVVTSGPVIYVSDGDTIGVRVDGAPQRIRLLGIDAPESKDPDEPLACYGRQAQARLATLLPRGSRVTLVTDPTQDARDKFGRTLAYVFRLKEHVPVNQLLLRDGAATVYVYRRNRPFRRIAAFRAAEAQARAARRGLWAACPSPSR